MRTLVAFESVLQVAAVGLLASSIVLCNSIAPEVICREWCCTRGTASVEGLKQQLKAVTGTFQAIVLPVLMQRLMHLVCSILYGSMQHIVRCTVV